MRFNFTARFVRLPALICLFPALSFPATWSGALVDAKCYAAEERNVNPTDTLANVNRDRNQEIRYCSPTVKTKHFAVVQSDGVSFAFDAVGNAKAAELVRKTAGEARLNVAVTGELNKNTIQADSISAAR